MGGVFTSEGLHYSIQSTAGPEPAGNLLRYMDLCFDTYRRLLNPPPERLPPNKFVLVLYRDAREYRRRGGGGRYGHYDGRRLVGYLDPEQMLPTFAHEGMHQFADFCFPDARRLPPWFSEGLAECIANNRILEGRLFMCRRNGPIPRLRAPVVREAIRSGRLIPLRTLLALDSGQFQKNHALCYAESWFLCHFLLTAPLQEDPERQIPDGKYKGVIVRFHNALLNPKIRVEEALRWALIQGGQLIRLDALETEFKAYILSFGEDPPVENRR